MPLTPSNGDALGEAIAAALNVTDSASIANYQTIYRLVYAHLLADITATLPAGTVVTTGSATTQTGPAAPVPVVIT